MRVSKPGNDSVRNTVDPNNDFRFDLTPGKVRLYGMTADTDREPIGGQPGPIVLEDGKFDIRRMLGSFALQPGASGSKQGTRIPNFLELSEGEDGVNVDMGPQQHGAPPMEFGVNAYTDKFLPVTGVTTNSSVVSNSVRIASNSAPVTVTLATGSPGTWYVNNVQGAAMAKAGDLVRIVHIAAATALTPVTTTLMIGTKALAFTSMTEGSDGTPDVLAFNNPTNVALGASAVSNIMTIGGLDKAASASVTNGMMSVNGAPYVVPGDPAVIVKSGDTVMLKQVAALTPNTDTVTTLTINGVASSFTSRTGTTAYNKPPKCPKS